MPREDMPVVGSPMVLDEEQRMMKRPREVEDEEGKPLIFKHMKRTEMRDIVDTLGDEEDLEEEIQKNLLT